MAVPPAMLCRAVFFLTRQCGPTRTVAPPRHDENMYTSPERVARRE